MFVADDALAGLVREAVEPAGGVVVGAVEGADVVVGAEPRIEGKRAVSVGGAAEIADPAGMTALVLRLAGESDDPLASP